VIWALLAAIGIAIVANLPLIYSARRFSWTTFADLWKLAPHQFFFSLFCIPVAVWLTCIALWWVLRASKASRADLPDEWQWSLQNWPVVFLVGIALAALVSAFFFMSTTWSPDKLRGEYANRAVASIIAVNSLYDRAPGAEATQALNEQKAQAASSLDSRQLTTQTLDARFSRLSPFERAQVTLTKSSQVRFNLTDEAAVALSAFQVLSIVAVAAVLLLTCAYLLVVGQYATQPAAVAELESARVALFCAICAFLPYPYLFGLYRSEMERAVKSAETGGQGVAAMLMIVLAAGLVLLSQPDGLSVFGAVWTGAIALLAVLGTVAQKLDVGGFLRQFVGFESTIGSQFILVIAWVTIAGVAVAFTWPRTG
jgi:hypothetical protein